MVVLVEVGGWPGVVVVVVVVWPGGVLTGGLVPSEGFASHVETCRPTVREARP